MDSVVYPVGREVELRTLASAVSLLATTMISYCFAQRAYHVDFSSLRGLFSMKATKWLLLLLFMDSWAFVFISGLLINGVGMSLSPATCSMGIFSCIIFYCSSKLLTYVFLLEKVYIVWPNTGTRMSSTAYKVGLTALLGFIAVVVMMVIGRIAYIRDDHQCVIGLHRASSMTTLFVDLGINILLTSLFLWPLWRSKFLSANIRRVASRTLVASFASLMISVTNIAVLTILHGKELAFICLCSCSTDILVNALVLFWLTRPRHSADEQSSGAGMGGRVRSENKSSGGGAVALRPISTSTPRPNLSASGGAYPTKSLNGSEVKSTVSIGERFGPTKVDFENVPYGFSEVYDGTQQYFRGDQVPPAHGRKPQTSFLPIGPSSYDPRRHSTGIISHSTNNASTAAPVFTNDKPGFFDRFRVRSPSNATAEGRPGGVRKSRTRTSEEDNMEVRVTVTTHLELEEGFDTEDMRKNSGSST